eukprot:gene32205-16755_t
MAQQITSADFIRLLLIALSIALSMLSPKAPSMTQRFSVAIGSAVPMRSDVQCDASVDIRRSTAALGR